MTFYKTKKTQYQPQTDFYDIHFNSIDISNDTRSRSVEMLTVKGEKFNIHSEIGHFRLQLDNTIFYSYGDQRKISHNEQIIFKFEPQFINTHPSFIHLKNKKSNYVIAYRTSRWDEILLPPNFLSIRAKIK